MREDEAVIPEPERAPAKKKLPNKSDKSKAVNAKPPAAPSENRNQPRKRIAEIDDDEEEAAFESGPASARGSQKCPVKSTF